RGGRGADGDGGAAGDGAAGGVGGGDGLAARRHESHTIGEGVGAVVTRDEGVVGGDRGAGAAVSLGEVDRAQVTAGRVVEGVQRRYREGEGHARRLGGWGAVVEVRGGRGADGDGGAAGDRRGGRIGGGDRLAARGHEGDAIAEGVGAVVA